MASLNAEPALPDVREAQHLPLKSYSDAVEEHPQVAMGGKSAQISKDNNGASGTNGTDTSISAGGGSSKHMASTLRIINTGAEPKEESGEMTNAEAIMPDLQRQNSSNLYSATVRSREFPRYSETNYSGSR